MKSSSRRPAAGGNPAASSRSDGRAAARGATSAGRRPAETPRGVRPPEHGGQLPARSRPPYRFARRRHDGDADTPFDRPSPVARRIGELLPDVLTGLGGDPVRLRLVQLWRHWEMVLGPELAPLARPLGHHKDTLLIGAEDAMLMQELHLQSGEILERVNAFMEGPFFASVKVSLRFQRTELDNIAPPPAPPLPAAERPQLTGSALAAMRADSAVARCYARFLALARASRSAT